MFYVDKTQLSFLVFNQSDFSLLKTVRTLFTIKRKDCRAQTHNRLIMLQLNFIEILLVYNPQAIQYFYSNR